MNILEIDEELEFLNLSLNVIDPVFCKICKAIQDTENALCSGLCEQGEFIAGLGFTICQKYITGTIGWIKVEKEIALKIGPSFSENLTYAQIINAAANYWKHHDEWDTISITKPDENGFSSVIPRDSSKLSSHANRTIKTLQQVTEWSEYTCINTLYEITKNTKYSLASLIPFLQQWRAELLDFYLHLEDED